MQGVDDLEMEFGFKRFGLIGLAKSWDSHDKEYRLMSAISKPMLLLLCATLFVGGCSAGDVTTDSLPLSDAARGEYQSFERRLNGPEAQTACSASERNAMRRNFLLYVAAYEQSENPQAWSDADVAKLEKSVRAAEADGSASTTISTDCLKAVNE